MNCAILLLHAFLSLLLPAHDPVSGNELSTGSSLAAKLYPANSFLENKSLDNNIGIITDSMADDVTFVEETDNDEVHNENTHVSTGKKRFSTYIQPGNFYLATGNNYWHSRLHTAENAMLPANGGSIIVFISQYRL